jgi:hypothetical protein
MKTILAIACMFIASTSTASEVQLSVRGQTSVAGRLGIFAGSLALGSVVHVNAHEGSHALAALASGHSVSDYRPIPHMQDGRFVFGSVSAGGGSTNSLVSGAPLAIDTALFITTDLALRSVPSDSPAAPALLAVGMVWPTIDAIRALTLVGNRDGDLNRTCRNIGVRPAVGAVVVGALVGVAVWRIADRIIQIAESN